MSVLLREWKKVLEADLPHIAEELREVIRPPAVLFLAGPVGVGKTTFVKAFVKKYSTKDVETTSPTYSLINDYGETVHADFYRLERAEDIPELELPLYLTQTDYLMIEWGKAYGEEIEKELPEDFSSYELDIAVDPKEETRHFSLYEL